MFSSGARQPFTDVDQAIIEAIQEAIQEKIPHAKVAVRGSGGHFEISVEAAAFAGLSPLEKQRLVYGAISKLMAGENAPVHAVDRLETITTAAIEPTSPSALPATASDQLVHISATAQAEVRRLVAVEAIPGAGLRLAIRGGGCSGLSYSLQFTAQAPGDTIIEYEGFRVFLDQKSTLYLSGVRLDFQGGLSGKGFVFDNPHATNTCGCGESFSL